MNAVKCSRCGGLVRFKDGWKISLCPHCLPKRGRPKIYPITRKCINPDCGASYVVKKHRLSKLCYKCAGNKAKDFETRSGFYYRQWLKGFREFSERVKKGEYDERA